MAAGNPGSSASGDLRRLQPPRGRRLRRHPEPSTTATSWRSTPVRRASSPAASAAEREGVLHDGGSYDPRRCARSSGAATTPSSSTRPAARRGGRARGARRRRDDRCHPSAGGTRGPGDRGGRGVRGGDGGPAGRARRGRDRRTCGPRPPDLVAARPTAVNLAWAVAPRADPARRGRGGGGGRGGGDGRGGRRDQPPAGPPWGRPARGAGAAAGARAHPLQHGRAGHGRVGDRSRHRPRAARAGPPGARSPPTRPARCCRAPG